MEISSCEEGLKVHPSPDIVSVGETVKSADKETIQGPEVEKEEKLEREDCPEMLNSEHFGIDDNFKNEPVHHLAEDLKIHKALKKRPSEEAIGEYSILF